MEYFDVVDLEGNPVGKTAERKQAHREGIRHRTAHIWVIRRNAGIWQVLLQKRSACKDSFPSCWDTSSAGHIQAGDAPGVSAVREMSEELGIQAGETDLIYAGRFHHQYEREFYGEMFRDDEVAFVYVYDKPVDSKALRLQTEELETAEWFAADEVREKVYSGDPAFCITRAGIDILSRYLETRNPEMQ